MGSGQHQQLEAPWSPAYYIPMHPGNHDLRPLAEFPTSPSSAWFYSPYGEFSKKGLDIMSKEYSRQQMSHPFPYDHKPHFSDNVVWLPNGSIPGDKSSFQGHILHGPNVFDRTSICWHCRMTFQRNEAYPDFPWKHEEQPHLEQPHLNLSKKDTVIYKTL